MQLLRANTAVDVLIGPFVDATDGATAETGLTLDVELSKNGQALANKNDATTATHDAAGTIDGHYNCELDATDTNTEGQLVLLAFDSAALVVRHEYMVMAEAAYDSMFLAKDAGFMDVNIKTIGRTDTQETEADNLETSCANYSAERGLTGTAVPATAAGAAGGIPTDTDSNGAIRIVDGTGAREINTNAGAVALVDLVTTTTTNTDVRGTDNAALASVVGALNDAAAADDPTSADTVMQYVKQLINVLIGTTGIGTYPSAQTPANGVNLAEVLRSIHDVANLDTAISELAVAAPSATPSTRNGLMLLYMALRNKLDVQTSGTDALEIHNNANTLICRKLITDDGADYSEAQATTG